jgi:hypothetical protein
MKTLYTGHVTVELSIGAPHYIYSFIYAETLLEAEDHLVHLLSSYVHKNYEAFASLMEVRVKVVSRPCGWNPKDGNYLPGTSKQYAQKYSAHDPSQQEPTMVHASDQTETISSNMTMAMPLQERHFF